MVLRPETADDLRRLLASAAARHQKVEAVDLSALNQIVEHVPEDMTATVQAGATLRQFQDALRHQRQWLPLDPAFPARTTIGRLLAYNLNGPRRCGFGVVRDYLIGIKVVMADGKLIKAGGKVVKNVAGYDLCKLFVGARNSLGVAVEATFKLRPLPESESVLKLELESLDEVAEIRSRILASKIAPVILDLHNLAGGGGGFTCVLGLAGAREDVEHQLRLAEGFGFREQSNTEYEEIFWGGEPAPLKVSVLPSRTVETLRQIIPAPFVARLGNGIIHYRGREYHRPSEMPRTLMERVKTAYDPNHILPEYRA